jgi:hypothetical protein
MVLGSTGIPACAASCQVLCVEDARKLWRRSFVAPGFFLGALTGRMPAILNCGCESERQKRKRKNDVAFGAWLARLCCGVSLAQATFSRPPAGGACATELRRQMRRRDAGGTNGNGDGCYEVGVASGPVAGAELAASATGAALSCCCCGGVCVRTGRGTL